MESFEGGVDVDEEGDLLKLRKGDCHSEGDERDFGSSVAFELSRIPRHASTSGSERSSEQPIRLEFLSKYEKTFLNRWSMWFIFVSVVHTLVITGKIQKKKRKQSLCTPQTL